MEVILVKTVLNQAQVTDTGDEHNMTQNISASDDEDGPCQKVYSDSESDDESEDGDLEDLFLSVDEASLHEFVDSLHSSDIPTTSSESSVPDSQSVPPTTSTDDDIPFVDTEEDDLATLRDQVTHRI